ncbi:MAG: LLM class flavin-dependent oxidoreductase [bacterium]|nr:LLM class flavin-dependent oxidoreductase [bacterium]
MAVRIGVGLGLGGFPFETIDDFRRWLDVCEDSPIDSIWQSDRVVSREPAFEPMTLLSVIAGATRRLKFGTNAVVLPFRDPVTFARQCATLDILSDGRFLPTVGVGRGDAPEWEATGRSPAGRGKKMDEALEVMTRLWTGENVDFEGEHYSLKGATINPRPKQQPLPLWLGGSSKPAIRRTARYGTGWLAPLQTPEEAGETVAGIKAECARIGRPIPDDHYGATILFRLGEGDAPSPLPSAATKSTDPVAVAMRDRIQRMQAVGEAGTVLARVREFCENGVTKFIAIPMARTADEMIDQCQRLATEVIPEV